MRRAANASICRTTSDGLMVGGPFGPAPETIAGSAASLRGEEEGFPLSSTDARAGG
jgi:hypothetical protein